MRTCKTCGTTDIHSNTTYHFLGTTTEDTTEKFSTNCSTNYEVQFSSFKGHKLKSTEYDDCVYVRCGWKCMCVSATVNKTYNQTLFAHLCGPVYCVILNAADFFYESSHQPSYLSRIRFSSVAIGALGISKQKGPKGYGAQSVIHVLDIPQQKKRLDSCQPHELIM